MKPSFLLGLVISLLAPLASFADYYDCAAGEDQNIEIELNASTKSAKVSIGIVDLLGVGVPSYKELGTFKTQNSRDGKTKIILPAKFIASNGLPGNVFILDTNNNTLYTEAFPETKDICQLVKE